MNQDMKKRKPNGEKGLCGNICDSGLLRKEGYYVSEFCSCTTSDYLAVHCISCFETARLHWMFDGVADFDR